MPWGRVERTETRIMYFFDNTNACCFFPQVRTQWGSQCKYKLSRFVWLFINLSLTVLSARQCNNPTKYKSEFPLACIMFNWPEIIKSTGQRGYCIMIWLWQSVWFRAPTVCCWCALLCVVRSVCLSYDGVAHWKYQSYKLTTSRSAQLCQLVRLLL